MRIPHSFARFCLVGLIATGIHYVLLFLLVQGLGANEELSSTCGFLVSTGLNYLLNRRYTFQSSRTHLRSIPRFLAVVLVGVGLNAAILSFGYRFLGLPLLAAQVLATGLVLIWNFSAMRHWVFPFPPSLSDDSVEGGSR